MPGYFERKRRERELNPHKKSIFDEIRYGSVIGILDSQSIPRIFDLRGMFYEQGLQKALQPFSMEILMVRDHRNKVEHKLLYKQKIKGLMHEAVILEGEKGSRIRHGLDRMFITLRGKEMIGRYGDILDLGFLNMHHRYGPILSIKENPNPEDIEIVQGVLDGLDQSEKEIMIEREVWGRWR